MCVRKNPSFCNRTEIGTHVPTSEGVCLCVLPSNLFWTSGLWTYQPGSHRRKVTQDKGHTGFSSTFLLRCLPSFFSREGLSRSFPSSTVKSGTLCTNDLTVLHLLGLFFFFFFVRKNPSPTVRRYTLSCII